MLNKTYPTIKHVIILCFLVIGIQTVSALAIYLIQNNFNFSDTSPIEGILNIFVSVFSFGFVILIGFNKTKRKFNEVFKFNKVSPILWFAATILTFGLAIVVSDLDNLLRLILPAPEWFGKMMESMMTEQSLIISLIHVGLVASFSEELLFRGVILDGLVRNYSKKKAIIISALLFGLIHLNPWQFLAGFLIGLVLAWICIETKSILLCIYIHLLNNTGATILFRLNEIIPIEGFNDITPSGKFQPIWFTLSGLFLLTAGILIIIKNIEKSKPAANEAAYDSMTEESNISNE